MSSETLSIEVKVEKEDMLNLFITALEGGCNYWAMVDDTDTDISHCEGQSYSEKWFDAIWEKGMSMPVVDAEEPTDPLGKLDKAGMLNGMKLMAEGYTYHYSDFKEDNVDAYTADVWFQLALMKEVVYG